MFVGSMGARGFDLVGPAGSNWKPLTGLLGRGEITSVTVLGKPLKPNDTGDHECTIAVDVYLDNTPMFAATAQQKFDGQTITGLSVQGAVYAVRVNPDDHSLVAIDVDSAVPEITLAVSSDPTKTAAYILEHGKPVTVVVGESKARHMKNADGIAMYAIELTVTDGSDGSYPVVVANPVPTSDMVNLFPGSKMHAKLGDQPNLVVVDWAAGPVF